MTSFVTIDGKWITIDRYIRFGDGQGGYQDTTNPLSEFQTKYPPNRRERRKKASEDRRKRRKSGKKYRR